VNKEEIRNRAEQGRQTSEIGPEKEDRLQKLGLTRKTDVRNRAGEGRQTSEID
jgi:hypothetical protein